MRTFLFFVLSVNFIACTSQQLQMIKTDNGQLIGLVTRETLFTQFPEWQEEMDSYAPDKSVTGSFGRDLDINIEIFFGTWCEDSHVQVPRFFRIMDETHFVQSDKVKLWAVDRTKKLPNGLTEERKIEYVATFIFFKDGEEIGRIVEQPESSLEADILDIISEKKE